MKNVLWGPAHLHLLCLFCLSQRHVAPYPVHTGVDPRGPSGVGHVEEGGSGGCLSEGCLWLLLRVGQVPGPQENPQQAEGTGQLHGSSPRQTTQRWGEMSMISLGKWESSAILGNCSETG